MTNPTHVWIPVERVIKAVKPINNTLHGAATTVINHTPCYAIDPVLAALITLIELATLATVSLENKP